MLEKVSETDSLSQEEFGEAIREGARLTEVSGRVVVVIPDLTRTVPVSEFFRAICEELIDRVEELHFLIALGTHPPLNERQIEKLVGMPKSEREKRYGSKVSISNHKWKGGDQLSRIGNLSEKKVERLSQGRMKEEIPVTVNEKIPNYDHVFIFGPVYPHEFLGFSGGYKYLFPGVSGEEITQMFHWLGALITNPKIIGIKDVATRDVLNEAARFVETPITAFKTVISGHDPVGLFIGDPEAAWSKAADLSQKVNVVYKDRTYHTVIADMPEMYDELWTAGKGMYKLEPVVSERGTLIIYGPHIEEISETHGKDIRRAGYHVKDYFLAHEEELRDVPPLVKAHCAHVKGGGTYEGGVEEPKVEVKLATGIPEEVCREINLAYLDPEGLDLSDYEDREEEGILLVRDAGEQVYRLRGD